MSAAVEKNNENFLYQQVMELIVEMKTTQTLRAGDRLPSLRKLADQLSVSIPTVKQAYTELERQGVIEARPKSGYFLNAAQLDSSRPKRVRLAEKPVKVKRQTLIEQVYDAIHQPGVLPLGIANPVGALPTDKFLARTMRRVAHQAGAKGIAYGPMDGFEPLKRQLAYRYLDFGMKVDPDEVLITNGAQEALAIALQCVAKPGDVIAVDSPCYFGVLELIESLGMMAYEIPLCPDDGLWLEDLSHALQQQPIKACVFSSSVSNPMGSFMPDTNRQRLVNLLEKNNVPLIEDDVYGDLYFGDRRGTPAQKYSTKGLVITCSSFSKTVAPSYRVGWMITQRFAAQARRLKRALSCSSSLLNQWALYECLSSGEYDRHVKRLKRVLRHQKCRMISLIEHCFPKGTRVSDPQGGCVLWLELPKGFHSETLFHLALDNHISLAPGAIFSPTSKYKSCFRISYGLPWTEQLETGVQTLGEITRTLLEES